MNEQEALAILGKVGAIITNSHIVYTSGKHGLAYVNKDAIYPHTAETSRLSYALAERFADDNVEVVIAPAIGGVILSQWTARHLSEFNGREVLGVYAEKKVREGELAIPNEFAIERGYDKLIAGKRVLAVEDVLTTGGSIKKVIAAARAVGGNVIAVGALCNRGGITAVDIDLDSGRLEALVGIPLDAWDEINCPLCRQGIPINIDVGKGREFLARKQTCLNLYRK